MIGILADFAPLAACYVCRGIFQLSMHDTTTHPMAAENHWKTTFTNWPTGINRRGIVVNILNESIPFKGFLTKEDTLLLERSNPDALGARYILMGFSSIDSVRFIDPMKESLLTGAGFAGKLTQ
jgi:hypothetical protein